MAEHRENLDYTGKAWDVFYDSVDGKQFVDADAETIFDTLSAKELLVSFSDYLKRYICEKAELAGDEQEIPLAEYTFEDIVDSYDLLFSAFLSGATEKNANITITETIDFYYYNVKIAEVKTSGKTIYYSIIPGPSAVLALSFQDSSAYRPAKDFADFLYGAVPNE